MLINFLGCWNMQNELLTHSAAHIQVYIWDWIFFILSKGVSQYNSDVMFLGGQKKFSDINQVMFCYNIKNLLKKKKKKKTVSKFAFPAGSGPYTIPTSALPCSSTSLTLWEFSLGFLGHCSADTCRHTLVEANEPGSSASAALACPAPLHSPRASPVPRLRQLQGAPLAPDVIPQKTITPAWPPWGMDDSPMSPKLLSHQRAVFSTHLSLSHTHTHPLEVSSFVFGNREVIPITSLPN